MRSLLKSAVLSTLVLMALPTQIFAAEPFYERLLQNGIRANAEGNPAQAIQDLTLACFGLLEEPEALMTCRIHLALAQAAQEDRSSFVETVDQVLVLEKRFEAYRKISLAPSLRSEFEKRLGEWVPYASLSSVDAFAHIAQTRRESELLDMSLDERRAALESMLAVDASNLVWQIRMADVELQSGEPQKALVRSQKVLEQDTELLGAICVRGEAHAALGNCEEALSDLFSCDEAGSRPEILMLRLECQVELRDWEAARTLVELLPASEKRSNKVRALNREIRRGAKEDARRQSAEPSSEADDSAGDGAESPDTTPN